MNFASLEEDLRRKLLMMQNQSTRPLMNSEMVKSRLIPREKQNKTSSLPVHDWGVFGEYEYLGPGTPYTAKHRAGIEPRNDLDQIAYYHDQQYTWTEQHSSPGTRVVTSGIRGISDYGAGSAMIVASVNPWSDLGFKDRVLGLIAGTGLQIQGILRLNPITMLPMAVIDQTFYS